MGSAHKDVMLYVNDGTSDVDLLEPAAGNTVRECLLAISCVWPRELAAATPRD